MSDNSSPTALTRPNSSPLSSSTSSSLPSSSSTPSPTTNDRCGLLHYLNRDGGAVGLFKSNWNLRWISLNRIRRTLTIFQDEAAYRAYLRSYGQNYLLCLSLANSSVYLADYIDKSFAFEISSPHGNFFFAGSNEIETKDWMSALIEVGILLKAPEKELVIYEPKHLATINNNGNDSSIRCERVITESYAKYGFLQKRGAINRSFKTRFFRTTENASGQKVLVYYDNPDSLKHNGMIILQGAEIKNEDGLEFSIVTPQRTFTVKAAKKSDKIAWIKVLTVLAGGDVSKLSLRGENNDNDNNDNNNENNPNNADLDDADQYDLTTATSFVAAPILDEDLYDLLGIESPECTTRDIIHAYKEKAKLLHPDKNQNDPQAAIKFQQVTEAYNVLKHVGRRMEYDLKRKMWMQGRTEFMKQLHENKGEIHNFNYNKLHDMDNNNSNTQNNKNDKKQKQPVEEEKTPFPNMLVNHEKQPVTSNNNNNGPSGLTMALNLNSNSAAPVVSVSPSTANNNSAPSSSTSSTSTSSSSFPSAPVVTTAPVEARIGDDGNAYRKRVIKRKNVPNTNATNTTDVQEEKEENKESKENKENKESKENDADNEKKSLLSKENNKSSNKNNEDQVTSSSTNTPTKPTTNLTVNTNSSSPTPSQPSPSAKLSAATPLNSKDKNNTGLFIPPSDWNDPQLEKLTSFKYDDIITIFQYWIKSPVKVFKLSHGLSSFKNTLLHLSYDSKLQELSVYWDSNKKKQINLDNNIKILKGMEEATEWKKTENQKKLPNPIQQINFVFAIKNDKKDKEKDGKDGKDKEKLSNFCCDNGEDFQKIMKCFTWIEFYQKKKMEERLQQLAK